MKKLTAFLTGVIMLLSATSALPVCALQPRHDLSTEQCEQVATRDMHLCLLSEDGIYYSDSEEPLLRLNPYIPGPGIVDHDVLLLSLAKLHPEAKFAVYEKSWVNQPNYLDEDLSSFMDSHILGNGMTFTEYYKAYIAFAQHEPETDEEQKQFDELSRYFTKMQAGVKSYIEKEYVPEIRRQETEKLIEMGIDPETHQGILTAEQVLDFPGHEKCGYFLGLAPYPDNVPQEQDAVLGDANADGTVDIMDVIFLNKLILGCQYLDDFQQKCADVNGDGVLEPDDVLNILKYVVGNITNFDEITKQPDDKQDTIQFDTYDDFADQYQQKYGIDPFVVPDYEDYHLGVANVMLEQNRYKLIIKPSGNLNKPCQEEGCLVTFTVEFQGEYSDYDKFLAAYEKMSRKIENISENRDLILMDDGSVYLCGKMPGREQVYIIEVSGMKDTEEIRTKLLRIAEKLGI